MNAPVDRIKEVAGSPRQGRTAFRFVSFFAVAAVLVFLVFLAINTGSAEASTVPSHPSEPLYTQKYNISAFGSSNETALLLPAGDVRLSASSWEGEQSEGSAQFDSEAGYEAVWIGSLTVGMATDGHTTIHGYAPNLFPEVGDLDIDSFSFEGESFVINNLVLHQVRGGIIQLVLDLDHRLRDDWIFQAKTGEYAVQDSLVLGSGMNIHAWRMDTQPDWTEGETFQVALWREMETQAQEVEPYLGPDPVDTLPGNPGADGILNPGDTPLEEIVTPGHFKSY